MAPTAALRNVALTSSWESAGACRWTTLIASSLGCGARYLLRLPALPSRSLLHTNPMLSSLARRYSVKVPALRDGRDQGAALSLTELILSTLRGSYHGASSFSVRESTRPESCCCRF